MTKALKLGVVALLACISAGAFGVLVVSNSPRTIAAPQTTQIDSPKHSSVVPVSLGNEVQQTSLTTPPPPKLLSSDTSTEPYSLPAPLARGAFKPTKAIAVATRFAAAPSPQAKQEAEDDSSAVPNQIQLLTKAPTPKSEDANLNGIVLLKTE